jgi:hypothetical protein
MDVSGHLLRRGVAAFMDQPREGKPAEPTPVIELPTWVIVMLATTAFGFLFVMTMVCSSSSIYPSLCQRQPD